MKSPSEETDVVPDEQSALGVLRDQGFVPPTITTDRARRLMRTLLESTDVPGTDTKNGGYLELHGRRRGAGDTLVREVGMGTSIATSSPQESKTTTLMSLQN